MKPTTDEQRQDANEFFVSEFEKAEPPFAEAHGSAIRDVPAGCQEIPGYILDVFDGSAWITQDGQVTDKWQERGIWPTPEAAAEMMERCLSPNDQAHAPRI